MYFSRALILAVAAFGPLVLASPAGQVAGGNTGVRAAVQPAEDGDKGQTPAPDPKKAPQLDLAEECPKLSCNPRLGDDCEDAVNGQSCGPCVATTKLVRGKLQKSRDHGFCTAP